MDRMRHQSGFTILEMMIVLSIVALLFLLTLPNIQQKEAINLYQLPNEIEPQATCSPGELRPRMTGRNFRFFARTSTSEPELILIDNRANIFNLTVKPRRWQKRLIFEAPK